MTLAITDIPLNYLVTIIKRYCHEKIDFLFGWYMQAPADGGDFLKDASVSNIVKSPVFFGGKQSLIDGENVATPGQRSFYYSRIDPVVTG